MYGNHMNPQLECVPARIRPESKDRENEKKLKQIKPQISIDKEVERM